MTRRLTLPLPLPPNWLGSLHDEALHIGHLAPRPQARWGNNSAQGKDEGEGGAKLACRVLMPGVPGPWGTPDAHPKGLGPRVLPPCEEMHSLSPRARHPGVRGPRRHGEGEALTVAGGDDLAPCQIQVRER
jgi:hypothetical protein